ncbi:hypothetical protein, partial [Staphylococcus intermedius]|uniref:hypothetical protein n=1 Tax=Staphylococcus intermedius TaxID=1285 RepID=UPI0030BC80F3
SLPTICNERAIFTIINSKNLLINLYILSPTSKFLHLVDFIINLSREQDFKRYILRLIAIY